MAETTDVSGSVPRVAPSAPALTEMLTSLLDRPTAVARPNPGAKCRPCTGAATYVDGAGAVRVVALCNLEFAGSAAAALSMLPPKTAVDAAEAGRLAGPLLENAGEVFNIFASLMNEGRADHVRLGAIYFAPTMPPKEVVSVVAALKTRVTYDVTVRGFPTGRLAFLINC